jgi:putative DNA primase/helicase
MIAPTIELDRDQVRQHLNALGIEVAHFQTFDDNAQRRDPCLARVLYGRFEDYADELEALNRQGAGVFVTINQTRPGATRRKEDVIAVRALFVDLDGAPIEPVFQWKLKPHLVVESSPDKFHAYWRTDGSVPLDLFTELQRRLIALFNGDKRVNDLPRVLRLAGSWHQKVKPDGTYSEPFMTQIFRGGC